MNKKELKEEIEELRNIILEQVKFYESKLWYEQKENFPVLMVDLERLFLSQNKANYLHAISCGHRLATYAEIDSLKKLELQNE